MMGKSIAIFHVISGGTTITLLLRFVPMPRILTALTGFRLAAINSFSFPQANMQPRYRA
jgi:hypothetical protein